MTTPNVLDQMNTIIQTSAKTQELKYLLVQSKTPFTFLINLYQQCQKNQENQENQENAIDRSQFLYLFSQIPTYKNSTTKYSEYKEKEDYTPEIFELINIIHPQLLIKLRHPLYYLLLQSTCATQARYDWLAVVLQNKNNILPFFTNLNRMEWKTIFEILYYLANQYPPCACQLLSMLLDGVDKIELQDKSPSSSAASDWGFEVLMSKY